MTDTKQDLVYLDEVVTFEPDDALVTAPEWMTIHMGNPNYIEINGIEAVKTRFCCEQFTEQNLSHFYFIPLYLNANYRVAYFADYSGAANPPDCLSHNGIHPVTPMTYNGMHINSCGQCPLFGYGKGYKCGNRPSLMGLAYFPAEGKLIPFRKDLPGFSAKGGARLAQQLSAPTIINGKAQMLPLWSRIVKAQVALQDRPGGKIPKWDFQLLFEGSKEPDMPHNFVPKDLLTDAAAFAGMAKSWKQQTGAGVPLPQLAASPPVAQLPGGTSEPTTTPPAQETAASVVSAEEESSY